ncbi:hypothetical protein QWY82_01625 [Simiduia curdlanivorans]|uniref:Uncharacterized protein n=1 Tax=Simiduia curdlanivorans TaxID=1492769 RepID=A0ABV8V199_9GAMM|nr:hypothetical protein [Simiduia curdlanivorans]MDN3637496.1 hypothetical protein [Simiduia curdlanivorans]
MASSYKNLIIAGAALFFIVIFYAYWEVNRSQALINTAEDPVASLTRGFTDAEEDFQDGHAHFLRYDGEYLGVSAYEATYLFNDHAQPFQLFCIFGLYVDDLALRISSYEYNAVYVTAYNTRLKTLASTHSTPSS